MRSLLYALPILIFAAIAGLSFQGLFREDAEELPSVILGNPSPPVTMEPLPGMIPFTDADLRTGGVKLVNFWASWCAPCRAEHPHLVTLAEAGIPVYGINYRDDQEKALAFIAELGDPFIGGGADPRGRLAVDWGVYGLPETYVVAADGTVLHRLAGPLTTRNWHDRVIPAMAELGVTLPRLD